MTAGAVSTRGRRPIPEAISVRGSRVALSRWNDLVDSVVPAVVGVYDAWRKGPIFKETAMPAIDATTIAIMRVPYVSIRLPDGCMAA